MDSSVIAALIGVGGTGFVGAVGWSIVRIIIKPLDTQIQINNELRKDVSKEKERTAVLRHLLTQAILRIEWLEELHGSHDQHGHSKARKRIPLDLSNWGEEEEQTS